MHSAVGSGPAGPCRHCSIDDPGAIPRHPSADLDGRARPRFHTLSASLRIRRQHHVVAGFLFDLEEHRRVHEADRGQPAGGQDLNDLLSISMLHRRRSH